MSVCFVLVGRLATLLTASCSAARSIAFLERMVVRRVVRVPYGLNLCSIASRDVQALASRWLFKLEMCSRQKGQYVLGSGTLSVLWFAKNVVLRCGTSARETSKASACSIIVLGRPVACAELTGPRFFCPHVPSRTCRRRSWYRSIRRTR